MTNDEKLTLRDVIEPYQLRWQIELFFKELKLHFVRITTASKSSRRRKHGVKLCRVTFVYLEWIRVRQIETEIAEEEREGVVASSSH